MEFDVIHNEDCLEGMKRIPDGSVDLTVTSPPYDNLRSYNGNIDQWSYEKFQGIAKELYRITKQGGVVVWVVGDSTIKGSETGTSFKQALFFKEIGFNIHDTMIYQKNTSTFPARRDGVRYTQIFEFMFVFSKGKPKTTDLLCDKKNKWGGISTWGNTWNRNGNDELIKTNHKISIPEYSPRNNIWFYNVSRGKRSGGGDKPKHPAPFPEQLAADHILSWSNPGDIVLDPFLGSGTTAKMAVLNERHYIGFELDPTYFDIACQRLDEAEAKNFTNDVSC